MAVLTYDGQTTPPQVWIFYSDRGRSGRVIGRLENDNGGGGGRMGSGECCGLSDDTEEEVFELGPKFFGALSECCALGALRLEILAKLGQLSIACYRTSFPGQSLTFAILSTSFLHFEILS